jgi:hypothetical protein
MNVMAPSSFEYVECDIPEGVSIRQWRHDRARPASLRSWLRSLLGRARRLVR